MSLVPEAFLGFIPLAFAHQGCADVVTAFLAAGKMRKEFVGGRDGGHDVSRGVQGTQLSVEV